jgi:signal peptidase II
MSSAALRYHLGTLALVLAIVGVDRWVKLVIQARLPQGVVIPVIPGLFNLTHIENPGAAFGLFANLPSGVRLPFLIGVSLTALGFLFSLYCHAEWRAPLPRLGLAFIGGGALGNLYERAVVGVVVDYLDVFVGRYHWPAFNVADATITLGTGLLILSTLGTTRTTARPPLIPYARPDRPIGNRSSQPPGGGAEACSSHPGREPLPTCPQSASKACWERLLILR